MTKVTHPLELSTTLFPIGLFICAAGMNVLDMNCCFDVNGLISTMYKLLPGLPFFNCMPSEHVVHLHACLFLLCCCVRMPVSSSSNSLPPQSACWQADSKPGLFQEDQKEL